MMIHRWRGLDCWSHKLAPRAELSRLCSSSGFSESENHETNAGIWDGRTRKERDTKVVHFLVNKLNVKALRSYAVFGFDTVGECSLFGQPFCAMKKSIKNMIFLKKCLHFENNLILYTSRVRQAAKTKYMRKCRNWQTSKTKDLVIIAIVWVQVPSSAL